MSDIYFLSYVLSVVSNVVATVVLLKLYGIRGLIHPFFIFLFTWLVSLISFNVAMSVGLDFLLIHHEPELNELFLFLSFTNISILAALFYKSDIIKKAFIKVTWKVPENFVLIYSVIYFIFALIYAWSLGFDFVQNRLYLVEQGDIRRQMGARASQLDFIFSMVRLLEIPMLIYLGKEFYQMYVSRVKEKKIIIFLIPVSAVSYIIFGGARAGIVNIAVLFFIGIMIGLLSDDILHNLRTSLVQFRRYMYRNIYRIVFIGLAVLFPFLIYVSIVSQQRSTHFGSESVTQRAFSQAFLGEYLFGIYEYSIFHIPGYQLRRFETKDQPLGYGRFITQPITKINVPVASQLLNENINIYNSFINPRGDVGGTAFITRENHRLLPRTTATVYLYIVRDFGFYGSFPVIAMFVFISQFVFYKLFTKPIESFWSIIIFIAVYQLWRETWFSHHLNNPRFNSLIYSAIVLSLVSTYYNKKKQITNGRY